MKYDNVSTRPCCLLSTCHYMAHVSCVMCYDIRSRHNAISFRAPTGAEVEWVQEESYFFRLSKFTHQLREHYAANPTFVVPASRQREMLRLLEGEGEGEGEGEEGGGLQDISVSRTSFSWGISVPRQLQVATVCIVHTYTTHPCFLHYHHQV